MKGFLQFLKFCIVGFSNTLITYGIYYLFTLFGSPYVLSYSIGFIIGMVNAFYWNNRYVFRTNENRNIFIAFIKMTLVYSISGFFLSNLLLFVLIEKIALSKYIAPIFVLIVTIPFNFVLNKFWSFKIKKGDDDKNEKSYHSNGSDI